MKTDRGVYGVCVSTLLLQANPDAVNTARGVAAKIAQKDGWVLTDDEPTVVAESSDMYVTELAFSAVEK